MKADRVDQLIERIDCVYFLLFPGWKSELRANRWHFASRWAARKPVVLVTPSVKRGEAISEPEPRMPNCRILNVQVVSEPNRLAKRGIQVGQVLADLAQHSHSKPLLWCYNPDFLEVYARVPAVARLYHASENYFAMPGLDAAFHARVKATIACSDVTIAVSEGVANDLRRQAPESAVVTVSNGCDFHHYSTGQPDAGLVERGRGFERIAVYAGNINARLDFELLRRLVSGHQNVLFAVYGPTKDLGSADSAAWHRVKNLTNVFAPGPIDPDQIRDVYAAADVGLIPYRSEPWLVENGLPLKALEMCATGLPVVSTLMKPLQGLTAGIAVTSTREEFLSTFDNTSRAAIPERVADDMRAACAANDYDVKFEHIIDELNERATESVPATRMDRLVQSLGVEYTETEVRFARWLAMPLVVRAAGWSVGAIAQLLPARTRRRLGMTALRQRIRSVLGS